MSTQKGGGGVHPSVGSGAPPQHGMAQYWLAVHVSSPHATGDPSVGSELDASVEAVVVVEVEAVVVVVAVVVAVLIEPVSIEESLPSSSLPQQINSGAERSDVIEREAMDRCCPMAVPVATEFIDGR